MKPIGILVVSVVALVVAASQSSAQSAKQNATSDALSLDAVDAWVLERQNTKQGFWNRLFGGTYCNDGFGLSNYLRPNQACGQEDAVAQLARVNLLRRGETQALQRRVEDMERIASEARNREDATLQRAERLAETIILLRGQVAHLERELAAKNRPTLVASDQVCALGQQAIALEMALAERDEDYERLSDAYQQLAAKLRRVALLEQ